MKKFLKMTLATIVGLCIFSFVTILLTMGIVGAIITASEGTTTVEPNSVFHLKLNGVLTERAGGDEMNTLRALVDKKSEPIALDEILKAIRTAANNENIDGIYLDCGNSFAASPASLLEIKNALAEFKQTGKFIVSYADSYSQGTYLLASTADKIMLNPYGEVMLTGIQMQTFFVKDLLDKIGVEMQVVKVGTYKSAVEPYINMHMSDANREQLTVLTSSIWGNYLNEISAARHLDKSVFETYANEGKFFDQAEVLIDLGLVDSLVYRNEMKAFLEQLTDTEKPKMLDLDAVTHIETSEKISENKIAVLYAFGEIDGGKEGIDSEKITEELIKLAEDDDVKAVVLRVNSPGGSAFGSEQMWHATTLIKAKKPLIVSMGDYAASGGYYMSCAADSIVAQPNTITGSIGIFGLFPNFQGVTKKAGINFEGVKTNELSDFGTRTRPLTTVERNLLQKYINRGYETFVQRCADGRHMTTDAIKAIGEGRVWSGTDALRLGLVDELGGLDKAIAIAAEKAELADDYKIEEFPAKRTLFEELMENFSNVKTTCAQEILGNNFAYYQHIEQLKNQSGIQARLPFFLEIN